MVLKKDPTLWLNGARPPKTYICKYIEFKIPESYFNGMKFGNKTIQQLNLPKSFVWGIVLLHKSRPEVKFLVGIHKPPYELDDVRVPYYPMIVMTFWCIFS
jgi:hypothetical protein